MSVSESQALTVRCPSCKAKAGEPCTYLPIKSAPEYILSRRGVTQAWEHRLNRVGKPTQRVHNERRIAVFQVEVKARRRKEKERWQAETLSPSGAVLAYRRAHGEELVQMREWLLAHYDETFRSL